MSYVSHADLGGTPGDDRVVSEPEDARFHAEWERRALAITLAMGATGMWSLDASRRARETLPDYERLGYYAIWIAALERLLVEHGLATPEEIGAGRGLQPARPVPRVLMAADVSGVLRRGAPTGRPPTAPARFTLGDRVRTRAHPVPHHTRLPGYARGKCGQVERVHGAHVFADTNAHALGEQPQWLYTIAFDGRELWGEQPGPRLTVSIDAWEPYLEPA